MILSITKVILVLLLATIAGSCAKPGTPDHRPTNRDGDPNTPASPSVYQTWYPIIPREYPTKIVGNDPEKIIGRKDGETRKVWKYERSLGGDLYFLTNRMMLAGNKYALYDQTVAYWTGRFSAEHDCEYMAGWGSRIVLDVHTLSEDLEASIPGIKVGLESKKAELAVEVDSFGLHGNDIRLRLGELGPLHDIDSDDLQRIQQQVEKAYSDWYDQDVTIKPVIFMINPGDLSVSEARSLLEDWVEAHESTDTNQ